MRATASASSRSKACQADRERIADLVGARSCSSRRSARDRVRPCRRGREEGAPRGHDAPRGGPGARLRQRRGVRRARATRADGLTAADRPIARRRIEATPPKRGRFDCPGLARSKLLIICHAARASMTPASPATLTLPTHDLVPRPVVLSSSAAMIVRHEAVRLKPDMHRIVEDFVTFSRSAPRLRRRRASASRRGRGGREEHLAEDDRRCARVAQGPYIVESLPTPPATTSSASVVRPLS